MRRSRPRLTLVEMLILLAIIFLVGALVLGAVGGCSVSDGHRSGVVTKFSRKGLYVKSWEGEMVLGGVRRSADSDGNVTGVANVWAFSCLNADVARDIENALASGKPVILRYHQVAVYDPFVQDTSYTVLEVSTNR